MQVTDPAGRIKNVWNVMKSPSADTDPTTFAISLSHNVNWHQAIGYDGSLAIVTFADALGLLAHPRACP